MLAPYLFSQQMNSLSILEISSKTLPTFQSLFKVCRLIWAAFFKTSGGYMIYPSPFLLHKLQPVPSKSPLA